MSFVDDYFGFMDEYYAKERNVMAKNKNFVVSGGYYFDTEAEALTEASRRSAKNNEDYHIYKAIKLVSPTTPNVVVTDVSV